MNRCKHSMRVHIILLLLPSNGIVKIMDLDLRVCHPGQQKKILRLKKHNDIDFNMLEVASTICILQMAAYRCWFVVSGLDHMVYCSQNSEQQKQGSKSGFTIGLEGHNVSSISIFKSFIWYNCLGCVPANG